MITENAFALNDQWFNLTLKTLEWLLLLLLHCKLRLWRRDWVPRRIGERKVVAKTFQLLHVISGWLFLDLRVRLSLLQDHLSMLLVRWSLLHLR